MSETAQALDNAAISDHGRRRDAGKPALVLKSREFRKGREDGWPAWTFISMAASVVVFAIFGWTQVRKQKAGGDPLVVPGLFRKIGFSGGLVTGMAFFSLSFV